MNYEVERNRIIRRYVDFPSKLNSINLDGNSGIEHARKVCDICLKLWEENMDFLTRPRILVWNKNKAETVYPDILTFIPDPFKPVIIEVINSEKRNHAENKSYPSEFKVISIGVDEELEDII